MRLHSVLSRLGAIAAAAIGVVGCHCAALAQGSAGPYVPTPTAIVDELLKFADVKRGEYLIDLGSGDGRIVITAAREYGAAGHGIDIQDSLVKLATANARSAGVSDRVHFIKGDLFEADLSKADLVTIYLLPGTAPRLVPKLLAELKPGARVISHDYQLVPLTPERYLTFDSEEKLKISGTTRTVLYRYVIPARIGGAWELQLPVELARSPVSLRINQLPDGISGTAVIDGRESPLSDIIVRGETFSFSLVIPMRGKVSLTGTLQGAAMQGTAHPPSGKVAWSGRKKG